MYPSNLDHVKSSPELLDKKVVPAQIASETRDIVAARLAHCTESLSEGVEEISKSLSLRNQQQKFSEWVELVSACRNNGLSVQPWRQENAVCENTFPHSQRRLYELAQVEREIVFPEITPIRRANCGIVVTVQISSMELAIHKGAYATTVDTASIPLWTASSHADLSSYGEIAAIHCLWRDLNKAIFLPVLRYLKQSPLSLVVLLLADTILPAPRLDALAVVPVGRYSL